MLSSRWRGSAEDEQVGDEQSVDPGALGGDRRGGEGGVVPIQASSCGPEWPPTLVTARVRFVEPPDVQSLRNLSAKHVIVVSASERPLSADFRARESAPG